MKREQKPIFPDMQREGLLSAIAIGAVLIIIGVIFVATPNLTDRINAFFSDMSVATFPFPDSTSTLALPAPGHPGEHLALYSAVSQFDIGIGVLQILILVLRLGLHMGRKGRIGETVGNLVFWFGAAYLVMALLSLGTVSGWFEYWAALIMLIGASIVIRGLIDFATKRR